MYIRIGNFEMYPELINWSVPSGDYYDGKHNFNYLLDESVIQKEIDKIGEGWRLPYLKEMIHLGGIWLDLGILRRFPHFFPYIIKESLDIDPSRPSFRIFYSPSATSGQYSQPWIPGYFIGSSGPRTFKIQLVRDI